MATGNVTELAWSRPNEETGVDTGKITLHYRVENIKPDEVWYKSKPSMPTKGTLYPPFKATDRNLDDDTFVQTRPEHWASLGMRLQRTHSDYFPGSIKHSVVTLVYATSRAWHTESASGATKRAVVWETETSLVSETVHFDLVGNPIPGGVQREVPLRTDRAILDGVRGVRTILEAAETRLGTVNSRNNVQGWSNGTSRFTAIRVIPKAGRGAVKNGGSDAGQPEPSLVELTFQIKKPDWTHRTIKLDNETGLPVFENNGNGPQAVVNLHHIYDEADFTQLFPPTWDIG